MKYIPHDYQNYCTEYIKSHPIAALFLDMGLGKTVITLSAIKDLMLDTFEVSKVLIIAPLRVARDTWPAEIGKWDHLKGLDISVIVGDVKTRIAAVHHPAMIYVVNRENIKWLVEYYEKNGMRWDFSMVVIDELSSFKNYQSQRFKYLRKVRPYVRRWVGLTGTPSSNGLMDLWAEIGILDGGERLGKFIGRYREAYFKAGSMNPSTGVVFQYVPRPGAEEMIYQRISDITISMKALDYLNMPDCIPTRYEVEMNTAERELYDMLKQDLLIPLKDGDIDAANAASLTGKLLQMSNGAVYDEVYGFIIQAVHHNGLSHSIFNHVPADGFLFAGVFQPVLLASVVVMHFARLAGTRDPDHIAPAMPTVQFAGQKIVFCSVAGASIAVILFHAVGLLCIVEKLITDDARHSTGDADVAVHVDATVSIIMAEDMEAALVPFAPSGGFDPTGIEVGGYAGKKLSSGDPRINLSDNGSFRFIDFGLAIGATLIAKRETAIDKSLFGVIV